MLETVIGQREAFILLSDIDPHFDCCLSNEEYDEVKTIIGFLKPFYDITVLFSGTSYPTANLYFSGVWIIHMKIKEVACVDHNPRYKLQFVEWCYVRLLGGEGVQVAKLIIDNLKAFFQEYLKSSNEVSISSS
ncbi:unnamed protein product [Vicia faba]|uniref:Uncharacterized protein n=1 Tax=Vicia faba TaxID=3906 RepID=A0AAV0YZ07_VICFA|nr:unnamed protein product [Vicia faba]